MFSYIDGSRVLRRLVFPLAVAVLTAAAVPAPAQAPARGLRCGDTVMRDTTLTADLFNCTRTGLILGADGITLDLNGHVITGRPTAADTAGILATGRRGVRVTGAGLIHRFGTAVRLTKTTGSSVDEVTVADSDTAGIAVVGGSADTVFHVTARNDFEGIHLQGGDHHQVVLNTVSANDIDASGIVADGHTTRVRIVGNNVHGTGFAGVFLSGADHTVVEANRITDSGRGVFVFPGSHDRISDNRISGRPKRLTSDGIVFSGGTGNIIDHNVIDRPTGDGIALSSFPPKGPAAVDTVVRSNVVRRAGRDAFSVRTSGPGPVRGTRLTGNRAERSGDDGFDVRSAMTTVTGNIARSNKDYGIVAVRGVRNGGHNLASGNGRRSQCTGVSCRTGLVAALRCGTTLRRDTTLTANLSRCRRTGLILGADGITLDLNAHTITGPGGTGIRATGRRGVHITGSGLIHHFDTAVALTKTTGSQVDQVTVADNETGGVVVTGGSADTVFHVTARNQFDGIQLQGGDRHRVALNTVSDSTPDASGIELDDRTTRARIVGNDVRHTQFGIVLFGADNTVVQANRMAETVVGVFVRFRSHNQVSANQISGGPLPEPLDETMVGIAVSSGIGNIVEHNVVTRPAQDGISVSLDDPRLLPRTAGTVVRSNVVRRAARDGFAVDTEGPVGTRGTVLSGNRGERSGDDGFDVRNADTTVTGNVARSNKDYGIVAVRGVRDGGHNHASGNGKRAQCTGVRCS